MNLAGDIIYSRVDNKCVLFFSSLFKRCNLALANQKLCGQSPFRTLQLLFDRTESFSLSFCLHYQSLCMSLCFKDLRLLLGFCHVDVCDFLSLRGQDVCSFSPFSLCLKNHRLLYVCGRFNVLNLIPECRNAPLVCIFLDVFNDAEVQLLTLPKKTVKGQSADFAAHSGLGKISDSSLVVFNSIGGFFWVKNLDVKDSIDVKSDVIFSDCHLGANLYYLLSQIVNVRDFFDNRDDKIETWLHLAIVLLEAVD